MCRIWERSCVENAVWCIRGPSAPVSAMSCTVALRNSQDAYTVWAASRMSSDTRKPRPS